MAFTTHCPHAHPTPNQQEQDDNPATYGDDCMGTKLDGRHMLNFRGAFTNTRHEMICRPYPFFSRNTLQAMLTSARIR